MVSKKLVSKFGAAMASLFTCHEIQAEILDITWENGQKAVVVEDCVSADLDIDQLPALDEFNAFNYYGCFSIQGLTARNDVRSLRVVASGELVSPATFAGNSIIANYYNTSGDFGFGTFRVAFKTLDSNVGTFEVVNNETMTFQNGRFADNGESLVAGEKHFILGDVNCDGSVDLLDVTPFVDLLTAGEFSRKADTNFDGLVSLLDVTPFVDLLSGG